MKRFFYYLMLILLTACESCDDINPKSELEKLPPATQQGKSTFGCLVNGKAWLTSSSTDALATYQSGALFINASIYETNGEQNIGMQILNGAVVSKLYDLTNDPTYAASFGWTIPCSYENSSTLTGNLTLTKLDEVNHIVSGLFEFKTFVSSCDTIKVTDGRFDLLYAN